ncbi:MAG: hypothetical protein H7Y31_11190 [Chitinophagaceae bacterium]|nr:hypothetical protein [Chitinophagaceae bacterium]
MKTVLIICLFATSAANAQGVFSNKTNTALQRVIEDYPNNFRNIKGDRIAANQQSIDYHSKINVPGASATVVTGYMINKAESYSWKSDLFTSTSFQDSEQRFKEVYNNIKNTIIKMDGYPAFILNGNYEYPAQEKKATTIAFQLLPASPNLQQLKVELSLIDSDQGWKIILNVYDKESSVSAVAQLN